MVKRFIRENITPRGDGNSSSEENAERIVLSA